MAAGHSIGTIFAELDLDSSRYIRGQQKLLKDATSTTLNIEQNFKNLNIKSSAEMDLMRAKISNSYERIKNSAQATANDILRAEQAKNAQLTRINQMQFGAQTSFLTQLRTHWLGLTAAIGSMAILRNVTMDIINTGVAAERMTTALQSATGSMEAARSAEEFLREESERLGLQFEAQIKGYTMIAAASRGTVLEGQKTRNIWQAVAEAGAALQMSGSEVEGALRAVSQIMSKGKVQAEELRGQLGERLPGAFQIAARAMGMTTAELSKQLELGNVYSDDFLPKFAQALHEQFGQAAVDASNTAQAAINRYDNALREVKVTLSTVLIPAYTGFLELLSATGEASRTISGMHAGGYEVEALRGLTGETSVRMKITGESLFPPPPAAAYTSHVALWKQHQEEVKKSTKLQKEFEAEQDKWLKGYLDSVDTAWKAEVERNEGIGDLVNVEMKWKEDAWKKEQADAKEAAKLAEQTAKDKADAYGEMYGILSKYGRDYTREDEELQDRALANRMLKLGETTGDYVLAMRAMTAVDKEETRKRTLEHGSFFDGMRIGMEESTEDTVTWAQTGYAIYNQFSRDAKASLSDNLFHALKGDFDEFELDWETMWDNMLHIMTDAIAEMAVDAGAKLAKDVLGEIGGWASSIFFHEGAWTVPGGFGLAGDEYPAVLQQGEMVIPKELATKLRSIWNSGAPITTPAITSGQYAAWAGATEPGLTPGSYGMVYSQAYGLIPAASYSAAVGAAEAGSLGALSASEAAAGATTGVLSQTLLGTIAGAVAAVAMPVMAYFGGRSASRKHEHAYEDWLNSLTDEQRRAYYRYGQITTSWGQALNYAFPGEITARSAYPPAWLTPEMVFAPRVPIDILSALPNAREHLLNAIYNQDSWVDSGMTFNKTGTESNLREMRDAVFRLRYGDNWELESNKRRIDAFNNSLVPSFATGTGPEGLPRTGWYYGHKKEIVLNNEQSESIRRGKAGGSERPMQFIIQVAGEEFVAIVDQRSDRTRVKAERRKMGTKRMY